MWFLRVEESKVRAVDVSADSNGLAHPPASFHHDQLMLYVYWVNVGGVQTNGFGMWGTLHNDCDVCGWQ